MFAEFDIFASAFWHGRAGPGNVKNQIAAIADQLQYIRNAVLVRTLAGRESLWLWHKVRKPLGRCHEIGPDVENVRIGT